MFTSPSFKGKTGLFIALGLVVALLIGLPAYRWFFLISLGIGVLVAGILFLWNKLHPVRPEDVDDKRPLKLD